MDLSDLRNKAKRGIRIRKRKTVKKTVSVRMCDFCRSKPIMDEGFYCEDHTYRCRANGCENRVSKRRSLCDLHRKEALVKRVIKKAFSEAIEKAEKSSKKKVSRKRRSKK